MHILQEVSWHWSLISCSERVIARAYILFFVQSLLRPVQVSVGMDMGHDSLLLWSKKMSLATYFLNRHNAANLPQQLGKEGNPTLHSTWEGEVAPGKPGFSAIMATVDVALPQDTLILAFRGTVGHRELLSYFLWYSRELLSSSAREREVYAQWDAILNLVRRHEDDTIGAEGKRSLRERSWLEHSGLAGLAKVLRRKFVPSQSLHGAKMIGSRCLHLLRAALCTSLSGVSYSTHHIIDSS